MNLKTNYLGLTLRNPIIVASSPWTTSLDKIVKLEEAGAGAVVLKSVFEEQINGETGYLESYNDYPEAADYIKNYVADDYIKSHLSLIKEAKQTVGIPIIASINCTSAGTWMEYARKIEAAGADALELNIFILPKDIDETAESIEKRYFDIVSGVTSAINIPVTVKLGFNFTNVQNICKEIYYRNGRGVVLFNRFTEPDIDVESISMTAFGPLSERSELRNTLRTIGLISPQLPMLDIAAATGVHTGEDMVKAILAGAKAVEICSTLYINGLGAIKDMNEYMYDWMQRHSFNTVADFCGILNNPDYKEEELYRRVQFVKHFEKK